MEMSMEAAVNPDRLAEVATLKSGGHEPSDGEMCVMEAVAYVAGEPWSDAPQCACPVITAFMVSWNDGLSSDAERDRLLKPLIPLIVGTRSTKEVEGRRSYIALDWMIRVYTPKWLDMVPALHTQAKALRELEAIADMAGATAAGVKVRLAQKDAAAAWAAAGDAAWAAAWAAAGDAAWAAAWAAAGDAAWAAARAAAWDAARDAARDAAWAALKPTTEWLQASALNLVREMIAVQPAAS
jgi:hypothetical protein